VKVEYHVFDVVDFGKSFRERFEPLGGPIRTDGGKCVSGYPDEIRRVETMICGTEESTNSAYARWVSLGYEGMMYRLGDCPYTVPKQKAPYNEFASRTKFLSDKDNRCWHLLKRKDWQDDEFECVAVVEGEGKLRGTLGALTFRHKDGRELFDKNGKRPSVGSGLTDAERAHYWVEPPIGRLVKVKYLVLSNDGIPLNPTILAIL